MSDNRSSKRYICFATIVYPESNNYFLDEIKKLKIPCLISPLHDQDLKDDIDEEEIVELVNGYKKAHYHVLFKFASLKSRSQVEEIVNQIGGVGIAKVEHFAAYCRYLCHIGFEDKHLYDTKDVQQFFGIDYLTEIAKNDDNRKYVLCDEMLNYIDANTIVYFADLVRYARAEEPEWYHLLIDGSCYFIKEYIKSFSYEVKESQAKQYDSNK